MATVTVTLTDAPTGRITVVVESRHPPIPFLTDAGDVDAEALTSAQAAAVGVVMWLAEHVAECDYRTLLRQEVEDA